MSLPVFAMTRQFDAPPTLVWRCWTEPDLIGRWYGPGVETEVHKFDPVVGGLWLHEMKLGPQPMYQRMEYLEVDPPSRLVMLMSNADEDWQVIANPMMENWPSTLLTTVTFEAEGDGTRMTLEWTPHEATEAERAMFAGALSGLDQGWGKGFDIMGEVLEELRA
ncbi:MAG: SRPBCC domain-containing protein [Pseudomonadota bacterium]